MTEAPLTGRQVRLINLTAKPALNGAIGVARSFHAERCRYEVLLPASPNVLLLKPENLVPTAPWCQQRRVPSLPVTFKCTKFRCGGCAVRNQREHACWGCGAAEGEVAFQICPRCEEHNLFPSYFCSKRCFAESWKEHRSWHKEQNRHQQMQEEACQGCSDEGCSDEGGLTQPYIDETSDEEEVYHALHAQALDLYLQKSYSKASRICRRAIGLRDWSPHAYHVFGLVCYACGDLPNSAIMLLRASERYAAFTNALSKRGVDSIERSWTNAALWAECVATTYENLVSLSAFGDKRTRPKWWRAMGAELFELWNDADLLHLSGLAVLCAPDDFNSQRMRAHVLSCSLHPAPPGCLWGEYTSRSDDQLHEAMHCYMKTRELARTDKARDAMQTMIELCAGALRG